ncbi:MAG: PVC-type heme-binding CxxCH protein [Pirellula sp.]
MNRFVTYQILVCCVAIVLNITLVLSTANSQGYRPKESISKMQLAEGLAAELVASEPLVKQPVAIDFDDRGRLWVIQYLQYPNPADLKRTQVDRYSRTKYDRIPAPPPMGPKGADRLTILQDSDGDGTMDSCKDFVDGLNLASGFAFGYDGVFVLNVPYLLFYADRNRDDVPDGPPEVLLTGFGMEDAHSVANSLTWGPDGWLYGCQGSTVTANIRGIEFQQGVWRYHPISRDFELFCEGGGNSWGLDFDAQGNLLYSTNYGGHVLLHGLQGGYFVKSFAKHGELHNPSAYGYFEHAPHDRFTGGHVTVGGTVYQADTLPAMYRNQYIAGDLLGHNVQWHTIGPMGSTVRTAHGGELLRSNDAWFATTDLTVGPEGAVYVADWHDQRTAHPDPDADWDRTNGRIYRVVPKSIDPSSRNSAIDISNSSIDDLVTLHQDSNQWLVRRARQELIRRNANQSLDGKKDLLERLRGQVISKVVHSAQKTNQATQANRLELFWTLYCLGGFDESIAMSTLADGEPSIRAWTVRFLGDSGRVSMEMAHRLDEFAEQETDVHVRQQIACTAARLPAQQAMPMINANINRDCDNDDPRLPLLWWWAVEKHSVTGRDEVMRRFVRPTFWKSKLGREVLMPRLVRRYAAENSQAGYESVVKLLKTAPDDLPTNSLWTATLLGMQQRPKSEERNHRDQKPLTDWVHEHWSQQRTNPTLLKLALLLDIAPAVEHAMQIAFDAKGASSMRTQMLGLLVGRSESQLLERTLPMLERTSPEIEPLRKIAIRVVSQFDDPHVAGKLIELLRATPSTTLATELIDALVSRELSAGRLLAAIDRGELPASVATLEQVRRISIFANAELDSLVAKHWGRFEAATREEKLAEVRRLNNDLRASPGEASVGKTLYNKHCAACHTLFGEGKKVGPDLTSANRQDRDFLLVSLVDPSSVIRKEYLSVVVATTDGRVVNGLPTANNDASITIVTNKNESISVARADIAEMKQSQVSIMPSDLYRGLTPQELRDLFAYLQRSP